VRPPALSGAAPPLAVQVPLLASRSGADSLFRALQPLLTLLPMPDGCTERAGVNSGRVTNLENIRTKGLAQNGREL
jgi:hypothetical protein